MSNTEKLISGLEKTFEANADEEKSVGMKSYMKNLIKNLLHLKFSKKMQKMSIVKFTTLFEIRTTFILK